jgi:hypothetical protein
VELLHEALRQGALHVLAARGSISVARRGWPILPIVL